MKVKTIRFLAYSAFITGTLLMILAATLPLRSDFIVPVMYLGGLIGVTGIIFCFVCFYCHPCPGCREFMIIRRSITVCCPCCNHTLQ